eukprot:927099-Rhodomonas_salina.1
MLSSTQCCVRGAKRGAGSRAEEAGVCVLGWRFSGWRKSRHLEAPTAVPAPQHCADGGKGLQWHRKSTEEDSRRLGRVCLDGGSVAGGAGTRKPQQLCQCLCTVQ